MAFNCGIDVSGTPADDLSAQALVVVTEEIGRDTQWELQLELLPRDGDFPQLLDDRLSPSTEIGIYAKTPPLGIDVLSVGPVEGQSISLVNGAEGSTLTVYGRGAEARLDQSETITVHEGLTTTDGTIVMGILAGKTMIPDVDLTLMARPPLGHPIVQRGSDLQLIRHLARRNGMEFWISYVAAPVGPVVTTGHFRKIAPTPSPNLPELKLNAGRDLMGAQKANIAALDIHFDIVAPTKVLADGIDIGPGSGISGETELPTMDPLGTTPFHEIGNTPRDMRLTSAADGAGDLQGMAKGVLTEAQFFLRAECEVSAHDLGAVLHAHDTVKVSGAGSRHSGRYIVEKVEHRFDDTGHTMRLRLMRNAWGEDTPLSIVGL
ncbi:phage late control D family protein [Tropicibacter sp. S64]|uniref:phage late control D family protein n=1 Tax=Tropicibacter sp. S64 TaxID=3415122 RepID=UPI003C7A6958